jgi:hypothetical protein
MIKVSNKAQREARAAVERLLLAVDRQIEAAEEARTAREELARVQAALRQPRRRGRPKASEAPKSDDATAPAGGATR